MDASLYINSSGKLVSLSRCKGLEIRFHYDKISLAEFDTFEVIYNSLKSNGHQVYFSFNSRFVDDEKGW